MFKDNHILPSYIIFLKEKKDEEKMSIFKCLVLGGHKWPYFSLNPLDLKLGPQGRTLCIIPRRKLTSSSQLYSQFS